MKRKYERELWRGFFGVDVRTGDEAAELVFATLGPGKMTRSRKQILAACEELRDFVDAVEERALAQASSS